MSSGMENVGNSTHNQRTLAEFMEAVLAWTVDMGEGNMVRCAWRVSTTRGTPPLDPREPEQVPTDAQTAGQSGVGDKQ